MSNLLDVSNPDDKINSVIDDSISNKRKMIENINKDIDSLEKQKESKNYFVEMSEDPKISASYVGVAIITIIGDILSGFGNVTKKIKQDMDKQTGGNANTNDATNANTNDATNANTNDATNANTNDATNANTNDATVTKTITSDDVKRQAENLQKLIEEAERKILDLKETTISNAKKNDVDIKTGFNEGVSKAKDVTVTTFKTGIKWGQDFVNKMIDLTMNSVGENDILNKPIEELSPELNKKLLLLAGVLKEMSQNPATKEAIREIAEAIGISLIEIMEQIKPELDKVTTEAMELLDQVAEKSTRGATATGMSVIQAFIAEIPYIGGIVDFMLAIGKGFNAFMEVFRVFSEKGGDLAVTNAKVIKKTEDSVNNSIDRIETAVSNAKNTLKEADKETPNDNMTGGIYKDKGKYSEFNDYIPNKKLRKQIIKGGNRLKKTLKMFNKTMPKMKYTIKNINKKNKSKKHRKYRKHVTKKHHL
jgi:hypothetical protein